jgi:hypothetical protein
VVYQALRVVILRIGVRNKIGSLQSHYYQKELYGFSSISLREKRSKRPYLTKTQGVVGSES